MTRYTGSWGLRLGLLLPTVCGFGSFYFMVVLAGQKALTGGSFPAALLFASVPFGLFGTVMAVYCLYGIVASFRTYVLDESGLEVQGPLGPAKVSWEEVSEMHTSSSGAVLTTQDGKTVPLFIPLVRDGKSLTADLETRLARVRERQIQEIAAGGMAFRPLRSVALFIAVGACVFLGFAVALVADPAFVQEDRAARILFLLLNGGLGVLLSLFALHAYTLRLLVMPELLLGTSLCSRREIPFDRITSVETRAVRTQHSTTLQTTVRGAGRKIMLSDNMPDYALVRAAVERRAGIQETAANDRTPPAPTAAQRRQSIIAALLLTVLTEGFGIYFLSEARAGIARYDRMDREGVRTVGHITGWYTTGGKSQSYVLEYAFTADGRERLHASPVSRESYYGIHRGDRVGVVYAATDPDVCRLTLSVGREKVEARQVGAWALIGFSLLMPVIVGISVKRSAARTGVSGSEPSLQR